MNVTMATRAAVRMSAEARREQLLDVTKAIVVERGFHAVSIEGVARDAGISRPIVYGHFDDLAGLLDALVAREGARALGQLAEVLPAALARSDPEERLVAALGGYLEAVQADPGTWQLVLVPSEGAPAVLHEAIARGRAAVVAQLAAALAGGERGLDAPDPELAAHLLSALADEAARLLLADPRRYPRERILSLARWFLGRLVPSV
jgi:AcrR family transcriptional regulator